MPVAEAAGVASRHVLGGDLEDLLGRVEDLLPLARFDAGPDQIPRDRVGHVALRVAAQRREQHARRVLRALLGLGEQEQRVVRGRPVRELFHVCIQELACFFGLRREQRPTAQERRIRARLAVARERLLVELEGLGQRLVVVLLLSLGRAPEQDRGLAGGGLRRPQGADDTAHRVVAIALEQRPAQAQPLGPRQLDDLERLQRRLAERVVGKAHRQLELRTPRRLLVGRSTQARELVPGLGQQSRRIVLGRLLEGQPRGLLAIGLGPQQACAQRQRAPEIARIRGQPVERRERRLAQVRIGEGGDRQQLGRAQGRDVGHQRPVEGERLKALGCAQRIRRGQRRDRGRLGDIRLGRQPCGVKTCGQGARVLGVGQREGVEDRQRTFTLVALPRLERLGQRRLGEPRGERLQHRRRIRTRSRDRWRGGRPRRLGRRHHPVARFGSPGSVV